MRREIAEDLDRWTRKGLEKQSQQVEARNKEQCENKKLIQERSDKIGGRWER